MRLVFGLVLLVGMALAGFAVYMAKDYINTYQTELAKQKAFNAQIVETTTVFVAKGPLRYGQRLREEDVRPVKWPVNAIPEGAFTDKAVLFPDGETALRTVLRAMEKDEALMAIKVTAPGEDAGVSSRLTKGMRAFTIKVDVSSGVSGFLRPGDRVDIYWTGQSGSGEGGQLTTQIQSSVNVIGIDQSADGDVDRPTVARTVTVEVSPQEVASLTQAQASGRLTLSLVGAEDSDLAESTAVDRKALLGIEEAAVVQVQKERTCSITTRRGAETIQTPVACPETN